MTPCNNPTTPRSPGRLPHGAAQASVQAEPSPSARRLAQALRQDPHAQALLADPQYLRFPAPGRRDPLTGLSRGTLSELVLPCAANNFRPPVRSVLLKKRGASRGIRLIHVASLLGYLDQLADHANAESGNAPDEIERIESGPPEGASKIKTTPRL